MDDKKELNHKSYEREGEKEEEREKEKAKVIIQRIKNKKECVRILVSVNVQCVGMTTIEEDPPTQYHA